MLWMLCCTFSLPLSLWSVAGPIWFHKLKMNLKDNLRIYTGYKSMRGKIVMGSLAVFFCKYNVAHENRKAAIVWGLSQAAHTACCDWQHSAKYSLMYGKKWRDLCHFIVCISFTFFALCCTEWNWEGICDCDDEMFFLGVGRIRVGVFNSSVCSEWVKNRENNGTKVTEVVLVVAGSSTTC